MAPRIQLNKFVRVQNNQINSGGGDVLLYTTPPHRAAIIISALAANTTSDTVQTVTGSISGNNYVSTVPFIKDFAIAPNDAANIVVNKLVLAEGDSLFVASNTATAGDIALTLSILETRNDQ